MAPPDDVVTMNKGAVDHDVQAAKMLNDVPVAFTGTGVQQKRFNRKTYFPDQRYSSAAIKERLAQSILHEFDDDEAAARIELAACYRLFGKFGWAEHIYNHLTAQVVDKATGKHAFLINAMGLRYDEVTASSLLKVDLDGKILHPGVVGDLLSINKAGFVIHSAIHGARHDVKAVMHSHFAPTAGISSTKEGFLELAQTSHICGPIASHPYRGLVVDMEERKEIVKNLGDKNVLFAENHGFMVCGGSIGEAMYRSYTLIKACEIQVAAVLLHARATAI